MMLKGHPLVLSAEMSTKSHCTFRFRTTVESHASLCVREKQASYQSYKAAASLSPVLLKHEVSRGPAIISYCTTKALHLVCMRALHGRGRKTVAYTCPLLFPLTHKSLSPLPASLLPRCLLLLLI